MLSKKSKIEELPKSRESPFLAASVCCKPQQDTYGALWSISCDTMWPPTSARVRRAGGVEKFSSPVRKTFFDSIDAERTSVMALPNNRQPVSTVRGPHGPTTDATNQAPCYCRCQPILG